jgi:predicted  nucleic acid-binding Zn-ribbon protein
MTTEILIALIAALPGILALLMNIRKQNAEVEVSEADADKARAEENETRYKTQKALMDDLLRQIDFLKSRQDKYKEELECISKRLADTENKWRSDVTRLGEEFRQVLTIVRKLLVQIEASGGKPNLTHDESAMLENLGVERR